MTEITTEPSKDEKLTDAASAILTKELHEIERRLAALRYRWWVWLVAIALGFLAGTVFGTLRNPYPEAEKENSELFLGAVAMLGVLLAVAIYGLYVFVGRRLLEASRLRLEYQMARLRAERLKESIEEDFFTKLVKINFRYLDQYYYQTQEQANKSFRLSVAAAAVGFGIVIVGIVMMFGKMTDPAYVTTGVGALSQFVAAVFFYLYNKTILKMGEYHQKLVLTQNIGVALKIAEGLPESAKVQSQQMLIERLTQDVNRHLADSAPPAKGE
jgi:MFS family permease